MTNLPSKIAVKVGELVDTCAHLKQQKDEFDKEYKRVKSELETICNEHLLNYYMTADNEMKISESRRFKAYSDDTLVMSMIPLQHRSDCVSLNKKKIDGLIKKGVLSNSIKDEEKFTRITTVKFTEIKDG